MALPTYKCHLWNLVSASTLRNTAEGHSKIGSCSAVIHALIIFIRLISAALYQQGTFSDDSLVVLAHELLSMCRRTLCCCMTLCIAWPYITSSAFFALLELAPIERSLNSPLPTLQECSQSFSFLRTAPRVVDLRSPLFPFRQHALAAQLSGAHIAHSTSSSLFAQALLSCKTTYRETGRCLPASWKRCPRVQPSEISLPPWTYTARGWSDEIRPCLSPFPLLCSVPPAEGVAPGCTIKIPNRSKRMWIVRLPIRSNH